MQRLISALEQLPLLRVHRRRLGCRDAEAAVLKELGAAQKASMPHAADHIGRTAVQIVRRRLHVPARRRDHAQQITAAMDHLVQRSRMQCAVWQRYAQAGNLDLCTARQRRSVVSLCVGGEFPTAPQVERHLPRRRVVKRERA